MARVATVREGEVGLPYEGLVGTHGFQLALDLTLVLLLPLRGNHLCLLLCKLSLSFNCLALWSLQLINKRVSIYAAGARSVICAARSPPASSCVP